MSAILPLDHRPPAESTYDPIAIPNTIQFHSSALLIDEDYLNRDVKPLQVKNLLILLLDQVKKDKEQTASLIEALQNEMKLNPDQHKEYQEALFILKLSNPQSHIEEIDSLEKKWLEDCIIVEKNTDRPIQDTSWKKRRLLLQALKISGYATLFFVDKILLNDKFLKIASAAGSIAAFSSFATNPSLPVFITVARFVYQKIY